MNALEKDMRKTLNKLMRNMITTISEGKLLDGVPLMLMVIENNTKDIIYANQNFLDYLGYELSDVIDRPYTDLITEESQIETANAHSKFIRGESMPTFFRNYYKHKLGHALPMYWLTDNADRASFNNHSISGAVKDLSVWKS